MNERIEIGLMTCMMCGKFGQKSFHINHEDCLVEGSTVKHPEAVVKAVLCRVEIIEELEDIPAGLKG